MTTDPSSDVVELRERVRDFIYDCTKDEFYTGWTLSADQTDAILAMVRDATIERLSAERMQLREALTEARKWITIHHGTDLQLVREIDLALRCSREGETRPANLLADQMREKSANQLLRDALEPFARLRADDGDTFDSYPEETILRCEVSVREIKQARAALSNTAENG